MEITSGINIKSILSLENSSDSLEMEKKKHGKHGGKKTPMLQLPIEKKRVKQGKKGNESTFKQRK